MTRLPRAAAFALFASAIAHACRAPLWLAVVCGVVVAAVVWRRNP